MYNITCESCFKKVSAENTFSQSYVCEHCGHAAEIPELTKARVQRAKARIMISLTAIIIALGGSIYWKMYQERTWNQLTQWQKFLKVNNDKYNKLSLADAIQLNEQCLLKNQRKCLLLTYNRIYELDASDVKNKASLAYQLIKFRFYNEGITILEQITNIQDAPYDVHSFLGIAYYKSQFYKEAITSFEKALTIAPNLQDITLMLADSHLQLGNFLEAKKSIAKFVRKYPTAKPLFATKISEINQQSSNRAVN